MKEKIYTVPVNDAFALDSECPICSMFEKLENDAVEYAMGPSYMEDDIRLIKWDFAAAILRRYMSRITDLVMHLL